MSNTIYNIINQSFVEWKDGDEQCKKDYNIYVYALIRYRPPKERLKYKGHWEKLKEAHNEIRNRS